MAPQYGTKPSTFSCRPFQVNPERSGSSVRTNFHALRRLEGRLEHYVPALLARRVLRDLFISYLSDSRSALTFRGSFVLLSWLKLDPLVGSLFIVSVVGLKWGALGRVYVVKSEEENRVPAETTPTWRKGPNYVSSADHAGQVTTLATRHSLSHLYGVSAVRFHLHLVVYATSPAQTPGLY